jgi:DNA-binding SARP family transcriptional activator
LVELELGVLGPLQVIADGRELGLGSLQQRALLALLLIHVGEPLSRDRIVDELWGERPPASANHAVQVYVSGIRKSLRGRGVEVRSAGAGYALEVDTDCVDAHRFEQLVVEAQPRLTDDPSAARGLFEQALALWRGRPLGEFAEFEFARQEADRLQELHAVALEGRVEARLAAGEHAAVIGEITGLAADNPLRERPRRLLMLALYRSGRHADALAAYRDAVSAFDEIGLAPGPELRALEEAILRHDPSLRTDSAPPVGTFTGSAPHHAAAAGDGDAWPLPALLRSGPRAAFVGRADERAVVEMSREEARAGARRIVLVSGEPGIGKSRLAAFAAHRAHADGFAVLWGACSAELAVPYEPWIAVCSQFVEHAPIELLDRHAARHGGELARLARELPRRLPGAPPPESSDSETERFLLFSAVAGALVELAAYRPVCLVLDDLHWADGQSVALLKHAASAADSCALQVIVSFRDSDLGRDHPLSAVLADLRRIEGVERIALHGLAVTEVSEVMAAAAGHELDADALALAGEIASETDGNPFFVGEVLRSLVESGRLLYDEETERWSVDRSAPLGLPESVRDVIGRRVERLGAQTRDVLTLAAVIGRSFELELLTRLVSLTEEQLLDLLEAAVEASLLDESREQVGQFRFVHALINQTLYEALGPTRRARMHHQVAWALEDLYGPDPGDRVAELALHWRLATMAIDTRKAADYSFRAGQLALDSLAPAEAVKLFADAVELLGPTEDADHCQALIGLGKAQQLTGDPAYRQTLLGASRIAATLQDAGLAASAALANTRGFMSLIGDLDQERCAAIERALELDDAADPSRRGQLLALLSQELLYEQDRTRRQALATEAIGLAGEIGDPRAKARALQHAFHGLWSPDMVAVRAGVADDLLANARAAEDRTLEFWALYLAQHVSFETGDFARAQLVLDRQQELAAALSQPTLTWIALVNAAAWALVKGDLAGGEGLARQGLEAGNAAGQPDGLQIYGEQRALVRAYQGRGDERLIELSRQAAVVHPKMTVWAASGAHYEAHFGRPEAAAALLQAAVESRLEAVGWDTLRLVTLAFYADAAARMRALDAAALLHELIAPWKDQFVWGGACGYGHARLWLGVLAATLGRDAEADEHFDFACRFHAEQQFTLWNARSHLGWSEALAARGEHHRAQEHASYASELARAHGYGLIEALAAPIASAGAVAGT